MVLKSTCGFVCLFALIANLLACSGSPLGSGSLNVRGEKAGLRVRSSEENETTNAKKEESNNTAPTGNGALSRVNELANATAYFMDADPTNDSSIPVGRLCSNVMTQVAQTNFFLAEKGVDIVFVAADGTRSAISAGDLSDTLLSKVLEDGVLSLDLAALKVADGSYTVGFCDSKFPDCKTSVVYADGSRLAVAGKTAQQQAMALIGRLRPGLFGLIGGLTVTSGKGTALGAAVLLNANLRTRGAVRSNPVYAPKSDASNIRPRLASNVNGSEFLAYVSQTVPTTTPTPTAGQPGASNDPRSNDAEDCDAAASPLVLDFGNDGVFNNRAAVNFDIMARGRADTVINTLDHNDYLLALDSNHNGKIDSGAELFGNYTKLQARNGKFENGFAALAAIDSNQDGVIDAKDIEFKNLKLWKTGSKELIGLKTKGVISIALAYKKVGKGDPASGNMVLQSGHFTTNSGVELPIVDLWYRVGKDTLARK